jgi:hypothetical protein
VDPAAFSAYWLAIIGQQSKPMKAEVVAFLMQQAGVNDLDRKAHPTVLRKLYRLLKALCDGGAVVALGDGGPGDPKRYCLNPLMVAIGGSKRAIRQGGRAIVEVFARGGIYGG